MDLSNERTPGEAPSALCSLCFQSGSFLWACHLLALLFSIQSPLMAQKGMPSAAAGPLEPSKQALSSPLCLWALCFQSLLLQWCLESSTPAPQLPGHFHCPPRWPALISHLHLKCSCWGPIEGSQMDRTSPCLVSLPSQTKSEATLCEVFCCCIIMFKWASSAEAFF